MTTTDFERGRAQGRAEAIKELETLRSELDQVAFDTSENGRELHLGHVEQYIEQHIKELKNRR